MAWAEAQARSQLSSVSQAINAEIQSARRMLNTVTNDSFKRETANWKAFQPYYALALMTSEGGSLAITRLVSRADSPAANWTANELSQYIGFMGKELESRGAVLLRSFKDPRKESHVAVIFAGGGSAYLLIGKGENFQALIESQKGSMSTFSIIASDGLTISHPMRDYIGNVMSDSALLKEIRSTGASHGLGSYKQGKKQIFGMYELVPRTNVYVMSTVPMASLLKGRLSLAWQFVFMLVGLGFIGAAIYFWQEKKLSEGAVPAKTTSNSPQKSSQKKAVAASPAVSLETSNSPSPLSVSSPSLGAPTADGPMAAATPQELQAEKAEAYRQVAAALGQEMRAPLASILGFSQMVLAKTQEPEVVQAVESILREARSSREVLENLYTFSGERSSEKVEAKVEGPLGQALKKLDPIIQQKGVKVEKDFKDTPPWSLASADLAKAFENLFLNAIEAMERMSEKVLKISVWEEVDGLHIRISDTGEGIEMENLSKVFDPFFTTRSFAQHVGLGLPVVLGILKEHQAQIQIQSQRGKGTHVDIVFASPVKTPASKPAELPVDLPKLSPKLMSKEAPPVPEPIEKPQEPVKKAEGVSAKPKDMNVDTLLELQEDEMPLQFLEGQGFDDHQGLDEAPIAPIAPLAPVPAAPPPPPLASSPLPPPPPKEEDEELPQVLVPPAAPALDVSEEDSRSGPTEGAAKMMASVMIDKPSSVSKPTRISELDSYKVEIRRPGKRK